MSPLDRPRPRPPLVLLTGGETDATLPGLEHGRTVFVALDEERTLGFLFTYDEARTLCLVALELERDGDGRWHAVVERVVEAGTGEPIALAG